MLSLNITKRTDSTIRIRIPSPEFASVIRKLFSFIMSIYLIMILVERTRPGTISGYLDLNVFLVPVVALGIGSAIVTKESKIDGQAAIPLKHWIGISSLALMTSLVVWHNLLRFGQLSYTVAAVAGVLTLFFSYLIIKADS